MTYMMVHNTATKGFRSSSDKLHKKFSAKKLQHKSMDGCPYRLSMFYREREWRCFESNKRMPNRHETKNFAPLEKALRFSTKQSHPTPTGHLSYLFNPFYDHEFA